MPSIHRYEEGLFLIDLDLPREGFRQFISAWLYRRGNATLLVDPGPRSTYPVLRAALKSMGVVSIDAVLLTHIHIDHAGGAGLLLQDYPGTTFFCHPKSFRHLAQPARLWEESRNILRDLADAYGEIVPIPENALFFRESFNTHDTEIRAVDTPGHAPHHLCFQIGSLLFAGEVAGVHYPLSEEFYLRPATPPGVRYDIFLSSIEKVAQLGVSRICFGHYGYRTDPETIWPKATGQLEHWLAEVERLDLQDETLSVSRVFDELVKTDPLMSCFPHLPPDIQEREKFFAHNTIRGMRQYLLGR